MIKVIIENTGSIMIIDKHNAEILKNKVWEGVNGYALIKKDKLLHREITNYPKKGYVVDHINGNKLDNRECNLRITSSTINGFNSKSSARKNYGTSHRKSGRYVSQISFNGKYLYLGTFEDRNIANLLTKEMNNFFIDGGSPKTKRFNIIYKKYEHLRIKKQKKQFCKNGHDLNIKENILISKRGGRNCRICNKENCKKYYKMIKETKLTEKEDE